MKQGDFVFGNLIERDILYVKLDQYGNVESSVSSKGSDQSTKMLSIFPNPVSNTLYFDFSSTDLNNQEIILQLYGANGQWLRSKQMSSSSIDVSDLVAGIYFYQVIASNGKLHTGRFVKR